MKSIIFYGTLVVLHKKIVRIQSNRYYIFKDSIIEDHKRLNKYTTLTEIKSVKKNLKEYNFDKTSQEQIPIKSLNKEFFIKENQEILDPLKDGMYLNIYQHQ